MRIFQIAPYIFPFLGQSVIVAICYTEENPVGGKKIIMNKSENILNSNFPNLRFISINHCIESVINGQSMDHGNFCCCKKKQQNHTFAKLLAKTKKKHTLTY